jgi:hypothetical protein
MARDPQRLASEVQAPRAIRLTFSFEGSQVRLLSEHPVAMTVIPSAALDSDRPIASFWFEVQNRQGEPLYRRSERNPFDPWIEVTADDPDSSLMHVRSQRRDGFFTLVVPDLNDAHSVALFGDKAATAGADAGTSASRGEIARFTLAKATEAGNKVADSTPPTTLSDTLLSYAGSAAIHLSASDNAGGSGVAHTYYKIDGRSQQEGNTVVVNAPGRHTLEFWSVDRAGNVEELNTVSFTIVASTRKGRA